MKSHNCLALACGLLLGASLEAAAADTPPKSSKPNLSIESLFSDKVVAKAKAFEVKQSEVDEMYITFKANRAAMGERVPETLRSKIEADMIEKIIATRLCLARATEPDRVKAKQTADQLVAEQMKQAPSEASFNRQLIALGMTPEKFRAQILEQAIVQAVVDREIKIQKPISDAVARDFYDKNPTFFQEPEMVRVSHILFSTLDPNTGEEIPYPRKIEKKQMAEMVLARARTGDDFMKLVKEFSDDASSKDNGGDYTLVRAKDDPLRSAVPEFEAAAFSLKENQFSDIVASRFGFHIIKLREKIPSRPKEFSKVEARIKETLERQEVQKELPNYIEKLKKDAGVEILSQKPKT
jgi:peptidyl-prolyl cis-trans isomerase C